MDYHDHPFWTERFESQAELREANALVFDGQFFEENFPNGMDEDDVAALNLAMDRDKAERDRCWQDEARALREENRALLMENAALRGEEFVDAE
jgi:hypothetical protein